MNQLLTKAEIVDILGISENNVSDEIVTWAETHVEKLTNKDFIEKTNTMELVLHQDESYIKLDHENIIEVSLFTIEDVDEDGLSEADDEYKLFKKEGIIYSPHLQTFKTIMISYKYGNVSVTDLDKYLHLLLVIKKLILTKPDTIPNGVISEEIGDYSVDYNVEDLKNRPNMIDLEIEKVLTDQSGGDIFFI